MSTFTQRINTLLALEAWDVAGGGTVPVTETLAITDVQGDYDAGSGGGGTADQFITSRVLTEQGRVRRSTILASSPSLAIYSGATPNKLLADGVISNVTGSMTASVNGNGDFALTKTGGGLSVITFPGVAQAAWVAFELVINGAYVAPSCSYADLFIGLVVPGGGLDCTLGGFRFVGQNGQNPAGSNLAATSFNQLRSGGSNPTPSTAAGAQRLYVVITHDYVRAGILQTNGHVLWGDPTDLNAGDMSGVRPGRATRLAAQRVGIVLSSDGDMAVAIQPFTTTYYGGSGAADNHFLRYEDATDYVDSTRPNRRIWASSCKGFRVPNTQGADHSTVGIYSTDITLADPTNWTLDGLLFVNRNGVVEGDFSYGGLRNRLDNTFEFNAPELGSMKTFNNAVWLCEKLKTSRNVLSGVTVFQESERFPINITNCHDPAASVYLNGVEYLAHSLQTGGPTKPALSKRTAGGSTWTRYDDQVQTDYANGDDEGNEVHSIQGKIFWFRARKHSQKLFINGLLDGLAVGTIADPVVQYGPLSQAQQSHYGGFLLPNGKIRTRGFTTDNPDANPPTDAAHTSFYEPGQIYTNGVDVCTESQ